jgi:hypothetical protein
MTSLEAGKGKRLYGLSTPDVTMAWFPVRFSRQAVVNITFVKSEAHVQFKYDVYFQGFGSICVVTCMCRHGTDVFTDAFVATVFVRRTQQEWEQHNLSPRASV